MARVLIVWLIVSFLRGARRSVCKARQARVEPWLGDHAVVDGVDLALVPASELVAFGVPGRPPQIVLSRGLIDALDETEIAAVIEHEVAHHRLRHWRYLAVLAGIRRACGWLPRVDRGVDAARGSLEEWADEESATTDKRRRETLRRALVGATGPTARVGHRLRRLEEPPPQLRSTFGPVSAALLLAISLTMALFVAGWFTDAHHAFALSGGCSH